MEDEDAEEILRALSAVLTWEENRSRDGTVARAVDGDYQVTATRSVNDPKRLVFLATFEASRKPVSIVFDPCEHSSEGRAKAACELHVMTGEWE